MTTYTSELPTMRDFLAAKVHSKLTKPKRVSQATYPVTAVLYGIVRVVLHLSGFALLTMSAFQVNMLAGLAVAGVSCFALSTLMTRGQTTSDAREMEVRHAPDLRTGR